MCNADINQICFVTHIHIPLIKFIRLHASSSSSGNLFPQNIKLIGTTSVVSSTSSILPSKVASWCLEARKTISLKCEKSHFISFCLRHSGFYSSSKSLPFDLILSDRTGFFYVHISNEFDAFQHQKRNCTLNSRDQAGAEDDL